MTKSKVGAEPKKQRVRHAITKSEGIHEGIHRDEYGYKEWKFIIGCHILWFDDIKDFARYYNLQDRLSFPLDRTTAECMENHLIHLPSGRTIEAVGTMDI